MRLQVSVHTAVVPKLYRGNIFPIQYRGKRSLMDFRKFKVIPPVLRRETYYIIQGRENKTWLFSGYCYWGTAHRWLWVKTLVLQTSDASCCAVGQQVQLFGLLNFLRGKNTPLLFNSSFVIKINFLSALRIEKAPASEQMLPQLWVTVMRLNQFHTWVPWAIGRISGTWPYTMGNTRYHLTFPHFPCRVLRPYRISSPPLFESCP